MKTSIYTEKGSPYLSANPTWHLEDSLWKAQQIIHIIEKNNIHFNTIADIGCGAGEILHQLRLKYGSQGHSFYGYEISPDAFAIASARQMEGLHYFNEDIELNDDIHFDVLLMIDVFEHVENYIGFIKNYNSKATYKIFHIPLELSAIAVLRNKLIAAKHAVGHLHFFMKETILETLADSGLEIIDHFYTPGAIELPKKPIKTRILNLCRRLLYNVNPDLTVRMFGGYSLMVLAK